MSATRIRITTILMTLCAASSMAQSESEGPVFPVEPLLFVDETFNGCEGISFNGEGRLFATCNRAFWEISTDGSVRRITELFSNLGTAAYGDRDILVADFGPTNAFRNGRNTDGIIWRISPEGDKEQVSTGIGDPNFILVLEDRSYLVQTMQLLTSITSVKTAFRNCGVQPSIIPMAWPSPRTVVRSTLHRFSPISGLWSAQI